MNLRQGFCCLLLFSVIYADADGQATGKPDPSSSVSPLTPLTQRSPTPAVTTSTTAATQKSPTTAVTTSTTAATQKTPTPAVTTSTTAATQKSPTPAGTTLTTAATQKSPTPAVTTSTTAATQKSKLKTPTLTTTPCLTAPGKVENLHIDQIPGNFTSVEVNFSCPNETERHGVIEYYQLSYEAEERHTPNVIERPLGLNISAQSDCNYSLAVPVTAEVKYTFSVQAFNTYDGEHSTINYTTQTGKSGPVASLDVLDTTAESIRIQWVRPSLPNGNIHGYRINVKKDGKPDRVINATYEQAQLKHGYIAIDESSTKSSTVVNGDGNGTYDYNITGLQSYTNYTVVISCININGTGEERNITDQTNMTAPGKVENLHIDPIPGNFTSVEVNFSCPNKTERHGVIEYYKLSYEAQEKHIPNVIERPKGLNISAQTDCNYSLAVPVTAEVKYTFSVQAFNTYDGENSSMNYTTQTGKSGPVASLDVLDTTAESIRIQWARPSLPNGNIHGYRINVKKDGKPDRVINATYEQAQLKHGYIAIDESSTKSSTVVNGDGNGTYDYNITGLQSYTNYTVVISCININGTGEERNITDQTNMTAPGKVENLHIDPIPGNFTSVEVNFSCPNKTERHGVIEYYKLSYEAQEKHIPNVIERPKGLNISAQTDCNYSLAVPVTAEVKYTFSVQAFNTYDGENSSMNYTTQTGKSGPVASLDVLDTTAESIRIQWARPSLPNGNIHGYQINVTKDGNLDRVINVTCEQAELKDGYIAIDESSTKSSTVVNGDGNGTYSYNITGLQSYTNYTVVISGININGTGEERNITDQTNMTAPGKVENLHIDPIPGNFTSVEVNFSCPNETERHGVIEYYKLSYEAQEKHIPNVIERPKGLNISAQTDCNYSLAVPVTAEVKYTFSVQAFNTYDGENSSMNYTTQTGKSGPVASLDVLDTTAESIRIQWARPSLPNGNIHGYQINVTKDGNLDRVLNVTCEQAELKDGYITIDESNTKSSTVVNGDGNGTYDYNITGLQSYTNYTVVISCVNINGTGEERDITDQTNMSAPGKVENLHIDPIPGNFTSVEVNFSCPNETERHGVIEYYKLSYEAQEKHIPNVIERPKGLNISAQTDCNYSLAVPVTAEVKYTFSVQAFNTYDGENSTMNYTTQTGKSGPVASLDVLDTTAESIRIQWARPSLPNGNIHGYQINVTKDGKRDRVINVTCEQAELKDGYIAIDESNTKSSTVVNGDGNGTYDYNITGLQSYTNYTVVISCININGTGEERDITDQTNMSVPSPPNGFWAFVNSSSTVTLFWTHAGHRDGPTSYFITVWEETHISSDSFEVKTTVSVCGFNNTSVLVEDLRSYWMYTFNITAATPSGNSSVLSVNETVRTKESVPGKVDNLHIDQTTGNYTSSEVVFSCPNETERNGVIKYYILSYETEEKYTTNVVENPKGLNISARPESKCNYSLMVPVTAQVNYIFSVQAFNTFEGIKLTKNYTTLTGEPGPVASLDVLDTTADSIMIQWTRPSLPNGNILGYLINVISDGKHDIDINVSCEHPEKKHACKTVNKSNTTYNAPVNGDGYGQHSYNITGLQSYTDYTIVISCININGTGEEKNTDVRTNMTIPSPPKGFWAYVNSSSTVTLFWAHADHQDGPTTYYIRVLEETHINSCSFEEKTTINVTGFYNTSVLVEDLRSYWNYTFGITAATPVGNSNPLSVNGTVRTKESEPGKVQNLHIEQIADNFTSVKVSFSCPNETERHGDIKYYTLSYEVLGDNDKNMTEKELNISPESQSNCTYSQFVSVIPQTNYKFSVVAHDSVPGNEAIEHHYAKIGTPGKVSNYTSTSTTITSVSLSWTPPRNPNGYMLGYVLYVHTEDKECQQAVYIVCTDCQSHGTFRVEDEKCTSFINDTVQELETSPTNYDVTMILSYTNYTFTVAAVNNFSIGINTSLVIQTDIDAPSKPGNLSASVLNSSAIEMRWTPPTHKSGPMNYIIIPQKATGRLSSNYENMENITVHGYQSSKRTINGLLSSWRYTFSIVASTSKGSSLHEDLGSNIITQESQPLEVQNVKVASIPGNFTAVDLTWDCPNETERNGFIRNYTIAYSDPGEVSMVHGHYEPEDLCDKTHTVILPVRPEHDYTFTVSANAMYKGKPKQSNVFHATAGKPLEKDLTELFISTAAQSTDAATDTSIVISFDSKTLLDGTNGNIIEAGIIVMKKSERPPTDPENVTDWDTWKNWYKWKNSGYKGSYRPTPEHYLIPARRRRSASSGETLTSYSVGVDENCDSKKDQFCNGPLEPETAYMVVAVSCTTAGCTSSEPFGNFKTKPTSIVGAVVGGIVAAIVVIGVVVGVVVLRRRRRRKSEESDDDEESQNEAEECVDKTVPRKITDFDEIVKDLYKDSKLLFTAEWRQLAAVTMKHPAEHAVLVGNRSKNRYVNIMAYDHSRVKLLPLDEDECSDYINANYIPGYNSPREYIASQGPLSQTTLDFWRMIWEQKVPIIVMLTGLEENGVKKLDMYWPEHMHAPRQYGDLVVELINLSPLNRYTIMIFKISLGNETRKVKHFFLPGWHDYNANLDEGDVIDFAKYVRAELKPTDEGPMLVHCSAGVGRTGTYLCVDYFIQVIENCDIDGEVDIFSYVLKMRNNRPFMVQSEKQYVFIYNAVKEMINRKKRALLGEQEENIYQNQGFVPDEVDPENIYMNVESGAAKM